MQKKEQEREMCNFITLKQSDSWSVFTHTHTHTDYLYINVLFVHHYVYMFIYSIILTDTCSIKTIAEL